MLLEHQTVGSFPLCQAVLNEVAQVWAPNAAFNDQNPTKMAELILKMDNSIQFLSFSS